MLNLIASWSQRLHDFIWVADTTALTAWPRRGIGALRIIYLTIRDVFFDSQLTLRAMSLVYTTLLSLVPLLAVSVSVLKGFGARTRLEEYMHTFLLPLGQRGAEISDNIVHFVNNINSGLLGSVGMAMLLYTVISLMQKIEAAFNFTWHVSEERSFARRFSDYLSVVLVGPLLVFAAMGLTAGIVHSKIYLILTANPMTGFVFSFASHLVPYLLIIFAFSLIYVFIPNTRVKYRAALVGASVAGILWETVGWLFASFVASANYTAIYSAFAALFFFMIWLYISWTILLTGASIAFYFQNPEFRMRQRRQIELSNRMKEKLALAVMALIAAHFYHRKPPLHLHELAQRVNIAADSLFPILNSLVVWGMLTRTDDEPTAFIPAQAPEYMQLIEILRAVREADENEIMNARQITLSPEVDALFQMYQQAAVTAMKGKTLKDLVASVDTDRIIQVNAKPHIG
jgi:membrane protein